jgi:hypothetical protein
MIFIIWILFSMALESVAVSYGNDFSKESDHLIGKIRLSSKEMTSRDVIQLVFKLPFGKLTATLRDQSSKSHQVIQQELYLVTKSMEKEQKEQKKIQKGIDILKEKITHLSLSVKKNKIFPDLLERVDSKVKIGYERYSISDIKEAINLDLLQQYYNLTTSVSDVVYEVCHKTMPSMVDLRLVPIEPLYGQIWFTGALLVSYQHYGNQGGKIGLWTPLGYLSICSFDHVNNRSLKMLCKFFGLKPISKEGYCSPILMSEKKGEMKECLFSIEDSVPEIKNSDEYITADAVKKVTTPFSQDQKPARNKRTVTIRPIQVG